MSFSLEETWSTLGSESALASSLLRTQEAEGEIMDYFVSWEIELAAGNPIEAARQARAVQVRHGTMATVFDVHSANAESVVRVDLTAVAEKETVQSSEAPNVFSRVELVTILHSLRLLQQVRLPTYLGHIEPGQGYDIPSPSLYPSAERFGKEIALSDSQINSLCERIEIALA
jgi:hypothetical protein